MPRVFSVSLSEKETLPNGISAKAGMHTAQAAKTAAQKIRNFFIFTFSHLNCSTCATGGSGSNSPYRFGSTAATPLVDFHRRRKTCFHTKKGTSISGNALWFMRKDLADQSVRIVYFTGTTLAACSPRLPSTTSNSTVCPSSRVL